MAEKVSSTVYRPDKKKHKKYWRITNELSIKGNIKALKYKSCLSFPACQKKMLNLLTQLLQFTDQQIQPEKHQTVEINLSIYVGTKYLPI